MILDISDSGGVMQVTAEFSNAVLVAMLPYVSDVARKLEIPLPQPITQRHVVSCGVLPYVYRNGDWAGCGIRLRGDWIFGFHWGYLDSFQTPHSYFSLQNPDEIPKFVGPVRMTKDEALQMARATLQNLGISLESVFAEQEPRVTMPPRTHTGIVPRYRIKWLNPRIGSDAQAGEASVDIEINADAKRVESLSIAFNPHLRRPWPKIDVVPVCRREESSRVNPDYAWTLVPIVLRAIDDYGKALDLPIPRPLTTNHVARFHLQDNLGRPHCEVDLTDGWRFIYRDNMVNGYYMPDNLFNSDQHPILIKDFVGQWNITENEAIALIRHSIGRLNHPAKLVRMDFRPRIRKPALPGIPRYWIEWHCENETHDDLVSKVEAEVDADRRELKSLYFEHKAFWGRRPPIDVPISLPMASEMQASKVAPSLKPQPQPKPLGRPPDRYKLPGQP